MPIYGGLFAVGCWKQGLNLHIMRLIVVRPHFLSRWKRNQPNLSLARTTEWMSIFPWLTRHCEFEAILKPYQDAKL